MLLKPQSGFGSAVHTGNFEVCEVPVSLVIIIRCFKHNLNNKGLHRGIFGCMGSDVHPERTFSSAGCLRGVLLLNGSPPGRRGCAESRALCGKLRASQTRVPSRAPGGCTCRTGPTRSLSVPPVPPVSAEQGQGTCSTETACEVAACWLPTLPGYSRSHVRV